MQDLQNLHTLCLTPPEALKHTNVSSPAAGCWEERHPLNPLPGLHCGFLGFFPFYQTDQQGGRGAFSLRLLNSSSAE